MRMWAPSGSFQPCRAFSCIAVTTASPSGWMMMPVWLPFHSSLRGVSVFAATNQTEAPL